MGTVNNNIVYQSISKCVTRLLLKEPFYAHILSGLIRTVSDEIPTLAVRLSKGSIELIVNPDFFMNELKSDSSRIACIKHEVLHIIFKHLFRKERSDYDPKLFNIAADMVVNQYIGAWDLPEGAVTILSYPQLKLDPDMDLGWYYGKLNKYGNLHQDKYRMITSENGKRGDHSFWGKVNSDSELTAASYSLSKLLDKAKEKTSSKEWGNLPGVITSAIEEAVKIKKPEIDWKRVLRLFASSSSRTKIYHTMKRVSRRFGSRPGIKIKRFQKIAVAVDTSGSIDSGTLSLFFSEIHGAWKQGAEITIVECDCEVGSVYKYNGRLPDKISGRGGTSFDPVFEWLNKNRMIRYDGCIYLTDGYALEPSLKPNCKLLWVLSPECMEGEHLKWGRVIKIR